MKFRVFTMIASSILAIIVALVVLAIGIMPLVYLHPPTWVNVLVGVVLGLVLSSWFRITVLLLKRTWYSDLQ